jgi:hypothetical protein
MANAIAIDCIGLHAQVPFFLYLVTHGYFMFYFTSSTILLRRFWTSNVYSNAGGAVRIVLSIVVVVTFALITAFMETYTINEVCTAVRQYCCSLVY